MPPARSHPSLVPRVLLALFVLSALAAPLVPVADAQTVSLWSRMDPRGFGWTFPEGTFPGAEATDGEGDVGPIVAGQGARPPVAVPIQKSQDLRFLRVDEIDGELLRFRVGFTDLDPVLMDIEGAFLFGAGIEIAFTVGDDAWRIEGSVFPGCERGEDACGDLSVPGALFAGDLLADMEGELRVVGQPPSRVLVDDDVIELLVPRWALTRSGPGEHPLAGDRITSVSVTTYVDGGCTMDGEPCYALVDHLPDEGTVDDLYTLALDSHGSMLKLTQSDGDAKTEEQEDDYYFTRSEPLRPRSIQHDAAPGETIVLPIWVHNAMDRKALATGTYTVVSDHEGVAIEGPDHFDVAAGGARKLQITVQGAGPFSAEDPLRVALEITSAGTAKPFTDRLELQIRHNPILSAETPKLYLHRYGDMDILGENGLWSFSYKQGVLSTVANDPADLPVGASMQFCCLVDGTFDWYAAGGLSRDTYLDPETKGTFHGAYDAEVPGVLDLEVVVTYDDQLVGSGSGRIQVASGGATFDIPLHISEEAAALPPAERGFRLSLSPNFYPGAALPLGQLAASADPLPPKLLTQGASWLEFPVIQEAPKVLDARHLVVDLVDDHDPLRYVNPGKTALWTVSVLNQGDTEDTVTIAATGDREGWETSVTPGDRFRLGPGETIVVGIRIRAPDDAPEADVAKVNVTAASGRLEGATSGLQVTAVATGTPFEEPAYEADNETIQKLSLRDKKRDSPGPGAITASGALALLIAVARRRSGTPERRS